MALAPPIAFGLIIGGTRSAPAVATADHSVVNPLFERIRDKATPVNPAPTDGHTLLSSAGGRSQGCAPLG